MRSPPPPWSAQALSADLPGVAGALTLAGLAFALAGEWPPLARADLYAAALALLGAVNLALALRGR